MPDVFRLTIRFLDPVPSFHGRSDGGEPEWPPSPLRAFQALVSSTATRRQQPQFKEDAVAALRWLEQLDSPMIVAPQGRLAAAAYRLYVPNNAADLVADAWSRGTPDA